MLEVLPQILMLHMGHLAMVVQARHSSLLIRWRAVIHCYRPQLPTGHIINHGRGRTLVDMRPTWNRTQVQPSNYR